MVIKVKNSRESSKTPPNGVSEQNLVSAGLSGVAGDTLPEKIATFNRLHNEDVWQHNDSYIVLGRDRPSNDITGYGGVGHGNASSIDIVIGRGAADTTVQQRINNSTETEVVYLDPDFKNDAARIYISQKTDIDKNFNLNGIADGIVGESIAQSAIGLKADSIRVMAREGIKLVSYTDVKDSKGMTIPERKGIDLISAPNDQISEGDLKNNMQPIPKGDNLAKALEDIVRQLDALSGIVVNFAKIQNEFNNMVAIHTHNSPFQGLPVPPSVDLQPANMKQNLKIISETVQDTLEFKMVYLNKFRNNYLSSVSELYINSRYHHLN